MTHTMWPSAAVLQSWQQRTEQSLWTSFKPLEGPAANWSRIPGTYQKAEPCTCNGLWSCSVFTRARVGMRARTYCEIVVRSGGAANIAGPLMLFPFPICCFCVSISTAIMLLMCKGKMGNWIRQPHVFAWEWMDEAGAVTKSFNGRGILLKTELW